ncbi:MAG: AAA family ATPase, partial [Thermoplasmata archaeon]
MTQNGIAHAIGTTQSYISSAVKKWLDKGCVRECIGRVENGRKKQKYFLLTDYGKEYTKNLKKGLSNLTIEMEYPHGVTKMMKFNRIIPTLSNEKICPDITELDLMRFISFEGTINIEHLKNINKISFHDFSGEAPIIDYFFGREREMALLEKWVGDNEGYNILFIHGIAGIGKTTLAAKLIENYRGSKHLFWHNFHELDTLRGVLFKLAKFLSKVGDDHLEVHLRTRLSLDYYEISEILNKSISNKDAILVFDNFHRSKDEIRTFFVYIYRMLISSSKTKMLVLSREIVPLYNGSDIIVGKAIYELELNGLDFDSCKKLLNKKGIDKGRFREMYKVTGGNPLFIEMLGGSKDRLERFIHDELISKLDENERRILGIISIYRFPVPEDCLALSDDIDFEKLYILTQKSIVKKDTRGRYFVHDIIKEIFNKRLSPTERKKHHILAARCYENRDDPVDILETIYHYQEAGKYKEAFQFGIDNSDYIFNSGHVADFLVILERFDKKK